MFWQFILFAFLFLVCPEILNATFLEDLAKNNWTFDSATLAEIQKMNCEFIENYEEKFSNGKENPKTLEILNLVSQICQQNKPKNYENVEEKIRQNLKEFLGSMETKIEIKKALEEMKKIKGEKMKKILEKIDKVKLEKALGEEREILGEILGKRKNPEFGELFDGIFEENAVKMEETDEIPEEEILKIIIKIMEKFVDDGENNLAAKILDEKIHANLAFHPLGKNGNKKQKMKGLKGVAIREKRQHEAIVKIIGILFVGYMFGIPLLYGIASLVNLAPVLLLIAFIAALFFGLLGQ